MTSSSAPTQQQQRNDGTSTTPRPSTRKANGIEPAESWVEIASQPSSSSLSSIGDEIVTTGLRVAGSSYPPHRRRRSHPARNSYPLANPPPPQAGGASSQEEYEASESDDDRALASSTEQAPPAQVPPPRFRAPPDSESDSESEDDDDDENATALGTRGTGDYVFRPEPNAFSNPPSTVSRRRSSAAAAAAAPPANTTNRPGPSHRPQPRPRRQPDYMSPSYQADNDAALRASLTTLLSCAAAARGLSKKEDERLGPSPAGAGASNQPMELRLVPEAELMDEGAPAAAASPPSAVSPSPARSSSRTRKTKRTASALRGARASKKKRTEEQPTLISPTLMTWVVSAGVVVLVSVVGFGAGYVIGREVGRQEVLGGGAVNASDAGCGKEVMRSSVRRLRFGGIGRTAVKS